jgi:hypothetical protein
MTSNESLGPKLLWGLNFQCVNQEALSPHTPHSRVRGAEEGLVGRVQHRSKPNCFVNEHGASNQEGVQRFKNDAGPIMRNFTGFVFQ